MEEIKDIIKKYDVGAMVVLHKPGFAEYYHNISPSYSCASFSGNELKMNMKLEHYNGDKKKRELFVQQTLNMFKLLSQTGGKLALTLSSASKHLDEKFGATHVQLDNTSHDQQNS